MLTAVMLAAMAAMQTPASYPRCEDQGSRGEDCGASAHARAEASLGLVSIEAEAEAGAEIYRARYVDGYGRDMPAVSFERRRGESPRLVVYLEQGRLTAPVPISDWTEVRRMARLADRLLVPEPKVSPASGPEEIEICIHSWSVLLEMANSTTRSGQTTAVRRREQDTCKDGLAVDFGFDLAARAVRLLPECDALRSDQHRNDVARLAFCGRLTGDRMAASDLVNQIGWGRVVPRQEQPRVDAWRHWIGRYGGAALSWVNGERVGGADAVSAYLSAKEAEDDSLRFYVVTASAAAADSVEVQGVVESERGGVQGSSAPFTQTWAWDGVFDRWVLRNWTVEPFQPRI